MNASKERKDVTEVYPHIYRIAGKDHSAHCYLVRGTRKNVLIDAGLPNATAYLEASLATLGLGVADVHMVVLTHEHVDHAGGVPFFSPTAVIAAHRLAANKLALKDEFALMSRAFGEAAGEIHIDFLLEEGATVNLGNYELQVLHTPGHCSGAVCIFEPTHGLLFSGDTIMARGVVGGVLGSGSVSDYIDSLKRLASLRVAHIFPSHGNPSDRAQADIGGGIASLQHLLDDAKALFDALKHSHDFEPILRSLRGLNIN